MGYLSWINTTVSLLSLVITGWYYTNMLKLTDHLQQANTLSLIHSEYASPKTLEALEAIEDFLEEYGVDRYAERFIELRRKGDPLGRRVDKARRWLVHWFSRIQYFYEFGYVTEAYLLKFPGPERSRYFVDIIEPLEYVSRVSSNRSHSPVFEFLRSVYPIPPSNLEKRFANVELPHPSRYNNTPLPGRCSNESTGETGDTTPGNDQHNSETCIEQPPSPTAAPLDSGTYKVDL